MRDVRVFGVFSTILKALLLANHVPTVTLVPEKLNGEFTENVTSGVVAGTFAGTAFSVTASGTCQRFPVIVFACARPTPAQIKAPTRAATSDFFMHVSCNGMV
jgi:hypothetical protein